jgi:hypothetical protein
MKIQVVISMVQGIIDKVCTYRAEKDALKKLDSIIDADIKSVEDWEKWQETEVGQDTREEIRWFETDFN